MLDYRRTLTISGADAPVVRDAVSLHLSGVGSGRFEVRAEAPPAIGTAARYVMALGETAFPVLLGVVAEAEPAGAGRARVLVRETVEALRLPAGFALRHCTPADVLAEIEALTGLRFLLPAVSKAGAGSYLARRQAHYLAEGDCRSALDHMGEAWGVPRCVWAQIPDGQVWWGDWAESPFNDDPVPVPDSVVLEWDRLGRALWLPALPALRPGMVLSVLGEDGTERLRAMLQSVELQAERMRVSWGEV